MSVRLRDLAIARLAESDVTTAMGEVQRIVVDVETMGRVEMVTLSIDSGGDLKCLCSDGTSSGPHVDAALAMIAGLPQDRASIAPRGTLAPRPGSSGQSAQKISAALDDLITAITRIGTDKASESATVQDVLARLVDELPKPLPAGVCRWIGRLRQGLMNQDIQLTAQLLDGASRFGHEILSPEHNHHAIERLRAWLGGESEEFGESPTLSDRTLIEVGREWLTGEQRNSVERRYLIDVRSGDIYCEERLREERSSFGPCPRQLRVGLAEIRSGPMPTRIRLLQYEIQPDVSPKALEALAQFAYRDFAILAEYYRDSLKNFPGLAEPFVIIAPHFLDRDATMTPVDISGRTLPFSGGSHPEKITAFELMNAGDDPMWITGRLTDIDGVLHLTPISFSSFSSLGASFHRLC